MLKHFTRPTLILIALTVFSCGERTQPVDCVNPYMGNISHLLVPTYPTVHRPNQMLRIYPAREDFTSDVMNGLPLAVTSHRGRSAFFLYPASGEMKPGELRQYTYDSEKITPYSWTVRLCEPDTEVRFSPSDRGGIYEFEFSSDTCNSLTISTYGGHLKVGDGGVSGSQDIGGGTFLHIWAEFSPAPETFSPVDGGNVSVSFGGDRNITLRYGISFIDEAQARRNMETETGGKGYADLCREGREMWNRELSKIEVFGGTDDERAVFYTSLYRTFERMININEYGRYWSPYDHAVHSLERDAYTDDWIWDSYRAAHPLRTIIDTEKESDMIASFIRMTEESDRRWMPTFPEITGDSHRMNGNHAVAVVLDAYRKGIRGFDADSAYVFCRNALTEKSLLPWTRQPLTGLDRFYQDSLYFPALSPGEHETCPGVNASEHRQAVAVTLAHSYDSWCLSELAGELGKEEDRKIFRKYSIAYRNLFNPATGFFHPKSADGKFIEPFDYRFSGGIGARDYYDENNGWTYRWDVQHDIPGLIELMGGAESFAAALDGMFREPMGLPKYEFYAKLPDQTGNVGQFTMANEPSLHIPYLYNWCGQPWKTQKRVRTLLRQWFRNDLMGMPGDEDGGGMSAFVVFSMMGFYPVTPGVPEYALGSPVFGRTVIHLENGRTFSVVAQNAAEDNIYVRSAKLNGRPLERPFISHRDIMDGGELVLEMDSRCPSSVQGGPGMYGK